MMLCGDKQHEQHEPMTRKMEHKGAYAMPDQEHTGHLSKAEAEQWVREMESSDGKRGAHWTMDQTTQVLRQRGYDLDPAEWYAIMNAMYADYCMVAKQFGVDNIDFYAELAKAWLCDEDAVEDKARQYWEHVAER